MTNGGYLETSDSRTLSHKSQ